MGVIVNYTRKESGTWEKLKESVGLNNIAFIVGVIALTMITFAFKFIFTTASDVKYGDLDVVTGVNSVMVGYTKVWLLYGIFIVFLIVLYGIRFITNKIAYRKLNSRYDLGNEIDVRFNIKSRNKLFMIDVSALVLGFLGFLMSMNNVEMFVLYFGPIVLMLFSGVGVLLVIRLNMMLKVIRLMDSKVSSIVSTTISWLVVYVFVYLTSSLLYSRDWLVLFCVIGFVSYVTSIVFIWKLKPYTYTNEDDRDLK